MLSKKLILVLSVGVLAVSQARSDEEGKILQGAGTSLVTGGTGAPDFVPVLTKFGVHWRGGRGRLDCLALAPRVPAGSV